MDTFKTQFLMNGVPTDVTVQQAGDQSFLCYLNLVDFFDGGEFEGAGKEPDFTLIKLKDGNWELQGESKVTLSAEDIQNLGDSIKSDYLDRNKA